MFYSDILSFPQTSLFGSRIPSSIPYHVCHPVSLGSPDQVSQPFLVFETWKVLRTGWVFCERLFSVGLSDASLPPPVFVNSFIGTWPPIHLDYLCLLLLCEANAKSLRHRLHGSKIWKY